MQIQVYDDICHFTSLLLLAWDGAMTRRKFLKHKIDYHTCNDTE